MNIVLTNNKIKNNIEIDKNGYGIKKCKKLNIKYVLNYYFWSIIYIEINHKYIFTRINPFHHLHKIITILAYPHASKNKKLKQNKLILILKLNATVNYLKFI